MEDKYNKLDVEKNAADKEVFEFNGVMLKREHLINDGCVGGACINCYFEDEHHSKCPMLFRKDSFKEPCTGIKLWSRFVEVKEEN